MMIILAGRYNARVRGSPLRASPDLCRERGTGGEAINWMKQAGIHFIRFVLIHFKTVADNW